MRSSTAPCSSGVVSAELEIDDAPHAGARDVESELAKRALDRIALRVEDPLLRPDKNGRFHRTTSGRARY